MDETDAFGRPKDEDFLLRDPVYNDPKSLRDAQIGSLPLAEADEDTRELVSAMELLDGLLRRRGWTLVLEETFPGVATWDFQASMPEDDEVTDSLMNDNRAFLTELRFDAQDAPEGAVVPLTVGLSLVGEPGVDGTVEPDFVAVELDGLDVILDSIEAHRHDSGQPTFLIEAPEE